MDSGVLARGEACGNFLLTSSDGSRYYAFWNGAGSRVFVAVSRFPHFSFTRQVLEVLLRRSSPPAPGDAAADASSIRSVLLTLCETPILPTCGVRYELILDPGGTPGSAGSSSSSACLDFNSSEQIVDVDAFMTVLSVFTPEMLVAAWESVILERKVLVVSTTRAIIAPCCDFLRRLVLPLNVVNTYVPLLPPQLINAIEAPFPYLIGADTAAVLESDSVDLSHIVVVDLDKRRTRVPAAGAEAPDVRAPPGLVHVLLQEVNEILLQPFGDWVSRPAAAAAAPAQRPTAEQAVSARADALLQLFIRTNLSLLCARDCTVRAFFRRLKLHDLDRGLYCPEVYKQSLSLQRPHISLGFDLRCGVAYGCMQVGA